nr:MAG TPA: hypothetical protein [Caudoviricetes sp.]
MASSFFVHSFFNMKGWASCLNWSNSTSLNQNYLIVPIFHQIKNQATLL